MWIRMTVEEGSPTRRSGRERGRTPKAVEFNRVMRGQNGSSEDETEDTIEVDEGAPAPPRPRHTEISAPQKTASWRRRFEHSLLRQGKTKRLQEQFRINGYLRKL